MQLHNSAMNTMIANRKLVNGPAKIIKVGPASLHQQQAFFAQQRPGGAGHERLPRAGGGREAGRYLAQGAAGGVIGGQRPQQRVQPLAQGGQIGRAHV